MLSGRDRYVCTGDPSDLCYNKTAKYSGVLQVAILYIYKAAKDKRSSCLVASQVTRRRAVCRFLPRSMYDV